MQTCAQSCIGARPQTVDRAVQKAIQAEPDRVCKDPEAHHHLLPARLTPRHSLGAVNGNAPLSLHDTDLKGKFQPPCTILSSNAAISCISLRPYACIPAYPAGCLSIAVHMKATCTGNLPLSHAHPLNIWSQDGTVILGSSMCIPAVLALS